MLEDYACLAEGYLALSGVTGQARWVGIAAELLQTALDRFGGQDAEDASVASVGSQAPVASVGAVFYDTADDGEQLMYRPADPADGPTPSGTFALAGALLSYSALTGALDHRRAAAAALGPLPPIAARFPRAAGWGLAVAEAMASGPAEIAVVGPPGDPRTVALHRTALLAAPPGAVIAVGDAAPGSGGTGSGPGGDGTVPLLAGRGLVDGAPAAYVCRGFACRMPVTEPGQLRSELAPAAAGT